MHIRHITCIHTCTHTYMCLFIYTLRTAVLIANNIPNVWHNLRWLPFCRTCWKRSLCGVLQYNWTNHESWDIGQNVQWVCHFIIHAVVLLYAAVGRVKGNNQLTHLAIWGPRVPSHLHHVCVRAHCSTVAPSMRGMLIEIYYCDGYGLGQAVAWVGTILPHSTMRLFT